MPFPIASANSWLWPGPDPLLVDCGTSGAANLELLAAGLAAAGVGMGGLRLVLTHGHIDHAGNAHALAGRGAQVCAMAAEAPFVETFRRDADRRNAAFAAALVRHGMPASEAAAAHERGRAVDLHTHDTALAVRWQGGERIAVGAGEAKVVAAPGHTPGSLLLLIDTNHLVTGDTLLEHITSNAIELLDADRGRYQEYLRTLDGLRRYLGCTALPGHGPAFALTETVLVAHAAKHERRRARVLAALDGPRSAYSLLPKVLPHLAHDQAFLGMCEVVGHLHALAIDGLVVERETPTGRLFERLA